jgi:hypothetical protein
VDGAAELIALEFIDRSQGVAIGFIEPGDECAHDVRACLLVLNSSAAKSGWFSFTVRFRANQKSPLNLRQKHNSGKPARVISWLIL